MKPIYCWPFTGATHVTPFVTRLGAHLVGVHLKDPLQIDRGCEEANLVNLWRKKQQIIIFQETSAWYDWKKICLEGFFGHLSTPQNNSLHRNLRHPGTIPPDVFTVFDRYVLGLQIPNLRRCSTGCLRGDAFFEVFLMFWVKEGANWLSEGPTWVGLMYDTLKIPWVVVSNICYFHPYLGKIPILTNIFQMGWNHQPVPFSGNYVGCL